ncbi:hypothetical protein ACFH04_10090 [Streptomyces noboritoensis]|uniref:Integral membrane protein n=1 Tax=Streptomyces noboritoensis TaxID=67337 RepID=A0ABV6TE44_9ACTN
MTRPDVAEWAVLDLSEDPTPGDPEVLKNLAKEYQTVSDDAHDAFGTFDRIKNQDLGKGKSMKALKGVLDELPNQVAALRDSYDMAAKAIAAYAPKLKDHQDKAAKALLDGTAAKTSLTSAIATATAASAQVTTLDQATPPPPDDEAAKAAARDALSNARSAAASANSAVSTAQTELDAAKNLALEAKGLREQDASVAAVAMGEAQDKAVKKKNFWDKLWDTIGSIFGIISAVLGVIAFFIPGLGALGLVLGAVSLILGLVPLGINIARGVVTGDWDIAGIVLGVLGAAFGGFAVVKGVAAGWGGIWKGLGQNLKGVRGGPLPGRPGTPGSTGSGDSIPLQNVPPAPSRPTVTPAPERPPAWTPPPPNRPAPAPPPPTRPAPPPPAPTRPAPPPPGERPPSSSSSSSSSSADSWETAPESPFVTAPSSPRPPSAASGDVPPAGTPGPSAPPAGQAPPGTVPEVPAPAPPPVPRPPVPDAPPLVTPPGTPTPPPSVTTIPDNPSAIGQYFQDMGSNVWGWDKIPGNIGAGTAFGGTIYAPGATAGTWSGTVHTAPLVGNTNDDGT